MKWTYVEMVGREGENEAERGVRVFASRTLAVMVRPLASFELSEG